jgi:hypothetical protein
MVGTLLRWYPLFDLVGTIALALSGAWLIARFSPEGRPLPMLSVMAFLTGLVLTCLPRLRLIEGESIPPNGSGYWRFRYATLFGYFFFVCFSLMTGTHFPSSEALINLSLAASVAGIHAAISLKPKAGAVAEPPPPDPSLWARLDRMLWHLSAPGLVALALLASLAKGDGSEMTTFLLVAAPVFISPETPSSRTTRTNLLMIPGIILAYTGISLA